MTLVPAVVDAVDLPVIADGGIADGRGVAAAFALGAVGAWIGTRFVASAEAFAHENYKRRIVEIEDEGTTRTRCFSGKPCRVIRNGTTESWENSRELQERILPFPRQFGIIGEWLGEDPYVAGRREGKVDVGALAAGQSSALIHDVEPAAVIVEQLARELEECLDGIEELR
jgi:enoyl-[acyl-carrier protein] reductase II